MEVGTIVTFVGIIVATLAGILGIWAEKDIEGSARPAKIFSLMLLLQCSPMTVMLRSTMSVWAVSVNSSDACPDMTRAFPRALGSVLTVVLQSIFLGTG